MRFQGLRMCDETARAMQFVKKVGMPKDLFMGSMTINRWESYIYNIMIESGLNLRFVLAMVNARHQLDTARILAAQYVDAW